MANTRAKKITKHSKKFERTQTGCLQCRQKKWVLIQKLRVIKTLTNNFLKGRNVMVKDLVVKVVSKEALAVISLQT